MATTITLQPADDTTNGWALTAPPRTPRPPLKGDERADWLVIGAGFAGLAAARRLAENRPHERVVLLEAECVGDGASGRNSGFVIDIPHNVGNADLANIEAARRALKLSRAARDHLDALVREHRINCFWSPRGQYLAAVSSAGEEAFGPFMAELDALGEPYRVLDRATTRAELGFEYYRGAVHTPGTVLMQPAMLVRGLADTLPANVTLYERSPVRAFEAGRVVRARTDGGTVEAKTAILAVNAFVPGFGLYAREVFAVRTFASLTRPLSEDERGALGGTGDWGIVPTNPFGGATLRYTRDHRLLFRHTITVAMDRRTPAADYESVRRTHERLFRARFPMLPDVGFEHMWVGYLCLSRNFAPGFGRQHDTLYTAVCQNGVGVTKGTIAGLLVADLACGEDNPLIADLVAQGTPVRLPPRPFLDLGAKAALAWWRWQGRAEA